MTLLIACLLIYGFGMNSWTYALAGAVWCARIWIEGNFRQNVKEVFQAVRNDIGQVYQSAESADRRIDQLSEDTSRRFDRLEKLLPDY